jgi:hypothetical protein
VKESGAFMRLVLTAENHKASLAVYHGFHDAEIRSITIRPLRDGSGYLDTEVELCTQNHRANAVETVILLFNRVVELSLKYDKRVDYPNVRDEIAIGFFETLVYVDFGSACEPRTSPEDFRSAASFFVCESVSVITTDATGQVG